MTEISGLTDKELQIITQSSMINQTEIDLERVCKLIPKKSPDLLDGLTERGDFFTLPTEEKVARLIRHRRAYENDPDREINDLNNFVIKTTTEEGVQFIKTSDDYYRFEPCVERILELEKDQLCDLVEYLRSFQDSEYYDLHKQTSGSFLKNFPSWDPEILSAENIQQGSEIYIDTLDIYERGLPNLLAFKRILDGEKPKNNTLQRKRLSSICQELVDTENNHNSVYFDLIVKKFDLNLRNGIVHGDFLNYPDRREVHIPSKDKIYPYEKFSSIIKANISNGVFLTGTFINLVDFHRMAQEAGKDTRDLLNL